MADVDLPLDHAFPGLCPDETPPWKPRAGIPARQDESPITVAASAVDLENLLLGGLIPYDEVPTSKSPEKE